MDAESLTRDALEYQIRAAEADVVGSEEYLAQARERLGELRRQWLELSAPPVDTDTGGLDVLYSG